MQSALREREVVDFKSHHWTFAKETVVLVLRAIDMDLGPVLQLEWPGRVIEGQDVKPQYVSLELIHSVKCSVFAPIQPRRVTFTPVSTLAHGA